MEQWLGGKKLGCNDGVIAEKRLYFEGLKQPYFLEGTQHREKRWTKCNELKDDYDEN